jgi:hypothetical protein
MCYIILYALLFDWAKGIIEGLMPLEGMVPWGLLAAASLAGAMFCGVFVFVKEYLIVVVLLIVKLCMVCFYFKGTRFKWIDKLKRR